MSLLHTILSCNGLYNDLFTTKWPQINNTGTWKMTRQSITRENAEQYYSQIAFELHKNGLNDVPHFEELITKINSKWTHARLSSTRLEQEPSNIISFSAKSEQYPWLSNFFYTLIVLHGNPKKVYLSAEEAYQKEKAIAHDRTLTGTDPLSLKKQAARISIRSDFDKEKLMTQILEAKFYWNPTLKEMLHRTSDHPLEEDTESAYWGTAHGQGGLNRLGILLASVREHLDRPTQT